MPLTSSDGDDYERHFQIFQDALIQTVVDFIFNKNVNQKRLMEQFLYIFINLCKMTKLTVLYYFQA